MVYILLICSWISFLEVLDGGAYMHTPVLQSPKKPIINRVKLIHSLVSYIKASDTGYARDSSVNQKKQARR